MNYAAHVSTSIVGCFLLLPAWSVAEPAQQGSTTIPTVTTTARRVANDEPASSFATVATALRYDPQIDLQSRGLAEGQADVTVRGSVFENTAFVLGAVTVMDPQTGHYSAELPVDPRMLSRPVVLTGLEHATLGANAAVASVHYQWLPLQPHRSVEFGAGSDAHRLLGLRAGQTWRTRGAAEWGAEFGYTRSDGDGSRPDGDYDLERIVARAQRRTGRSQSDFVAAYQDKFIGWPGAYTGFATLPETDHTKTTLLIANHRIDGGIGRDGDYLEIGGYYRDLDDDYDFDRRTAEAGAPGSFDHRTRSYGIGLQARRRIGNWDWHLGSQWQGDELVRSTDLNFGAFDNRQQARLSLLAARRWLVNEHAALTGRLGATWDASNRDSDALSPLAGLELEWGVTAAGSDRLRLDVTRTTQVPGYTALNSAPAGLFGGNRDLGRERAETAALAFTRRRGPWRGVLAAFQRRDKDLVDWTFLQGAPFARQANAVDIDVTGFEAGLERRGTTVVMVAGYSYLDKEADYGTASVDASYYALNYATHRLTLAWEIATGDHLTFRWDNEFRRQADNPLRSGSRDAYQTSMALDWVPPGMPRLSTSLRVDNLTNSNFEEFPGTPAAQRRISVKARWSW